MNGYVIRSVLCALSLSASTTATPLTLYGLYSGGPVPTSTLATVNPVTGAVSAIGPTGAWLMAMTFDPFQGKMYAIGADFTGAGDALYSLNLKTGAATKVGYVGEQNFFGLAVDQSGSLFGVRANDGDGGTVSAGLYSINQQNAHAARIAPLSPSLGAPGQPGASPRSLAFDPSTATMYMATEGCLVGPAPSYPCSLDLNGLSTLNIHDGSFNFLGTFKGPGGPSSLYNNVRAIAFDSAHSIMFGSDASTLLTIDRSTGQATQIGKLTGLPTGVFSLDALAFTSISHVPEPATCILTFLGLGATSALRWVRRN